MKTVGQILSESRRKKNLTLEEVERYTKIRKKILQALEDGDWSILPSPTFVKGLIKNYGKFLGLEQNELLAFYRREFDEKKVPKKIVAQNKVRGSRFRFTPQIVTVGVIGIIVLAVAAYLFFQYQSFTGPPLLEISEPSNNIKVNSLEVNLVGRTWEDSILKINGQEVPISPGGTFSLAVGLTPGINTLTVTAANRFGKISTQKRTIVADIVRQNQDNQLSGGVNLTIKIGPESANLTVEVDGLKQFEGVLLAGTEKIFHGNSGIKIHTKNGGSTKVSFSNQENLLGKPGEEIEKLFP